MIFRAAGGEALALVEFQRCQSARLGSPIDDVLSGHPLSGKGLEGYTAQLVRHSRWIAEVERINSVHSGYRPAAWQDLHHYVLWFHDSTFECIAEAYTVELHELSLADFSPRPVGGWSGDGRSYGRPLAMSSVSSVESSSPDIAGS